MWSYFPTLTALIPLGRQRASLENWVQGGHESSGTYGQMTEAMGCVWKANLFSRLSRLAGGSVGIVLA